MASEVRKTPAEYRDFSAQLKTIVQSKETVPTELWARFTAMYTKLMTEGSEKISECQQLPASENPDLKAISTEFFANLNAIQQKLETLKTVDPIEKFSEGCGKTVSGLKDKIKDAGKLELKDLEEYKKLHDDLKKKGNNELSKLDAKNPQVQQASLNFVADLKDVLDNIVQRSISEFSCGKLAGDLKTNLQYEPEMRSEKLEKFEKLHRDLLAKGSQQLSNIAKIDPKNLLLVQVSEAFFTTMQEVLANIAKLRKPIDLNTRAILLDEGLATLNTIDEKTFTGTVTSVTSLFRDSKEIYADKSDDVLLALSKDFSHTMESVLGKLEFLKTTLPQKAEAKSLFSRFAEFIKKKPAAEEDVDGDDEVDPKELFSMKALGEEFTIVDLTPRDANLAALWRQAQEEPVIVEAPVKILTPLQQSLTAIKDAIRELKDNRDALNQKLGGLLKAIPNKELQDSISFLVWENGGKQQIDNYGYEHAADDLPFFEKLIDDALKS